MSTWKRILDRAQRAGNKATSVASEASSKLKEYVDENKDEWLEKSTLYGEQAKEVASEFISEARQKGKDQAKATYIQTRYSRKRLQELEQRVENQGAMYREVLRSRRIHDTIFVGGESFSSLLIATSIPVEIEDAYTAAFPNMSDEITLQDKLRNLDGDNEIEGLLSAIKGKLFEQQYVTYLNSANLPEGYVAKLADSTNQKGWDIQIVGPNNGLAQLLQAKATDSVSYVKEAIDRYPSIDVVTTEEVYSHLVMAGVSDGISSGGISNVELAEQVEEAATAVDLDFQFAPPVLTLAFIAFTSYRTESLTLYEKARSAGDRSAKAYFSYLIGGGIAALTNTWWLGVLGSASSRYIGDEGLRKVELVDSLKRTIENNQRIIDRLRGRPTDLVPQ